MVLLWTILPSNIVSQDIRQYQTDIQGNSYKIFDQEIVKYNAATQEEFRYSSKLFGNITILDATNPLRPIIFFEGVQKIVVTDNTLSGQSQQVISFEELGMFQVKCVATSRIDNGIWLYDQELLQLVKLDRTLNRVIETGNLLQLLNLKDLSPSRMIEKNGYLYVYCPHNGILIFDIYGTYYKSIPIRKLDVWNVYEQQIIYAGEEGPYIYDLMDFESYKLQITLEESEQLLWIDQEFLYFTDEQHQIQKVKINQP